jgi:hypothetical protein
MQGNVRELKNSRVKKFPELKRGDIFDAYLGEIQKEYGDGDLDTTTGEFIPKEQQ